MITGPKSLITRQGNDVKVTLFRARETAYMDRKCQQGGKYSKGCVIVWDDHVSIEFRGAIWFRYFAASVCVLSFQPLEDTNSRGCDL